MKLPLGDLKATYNNAWRCFPPPLPGLNLIGIKTMLDTVEEQKYS